MSRYDHLIGTELARGTWSWDADLTMLYAVGCGAGLQDNLAELQFTTENTPGVPQAVLPSFLARMGLRSDWPTMLGWGEEGTTIIGLVHGEQRIALARPIPPSGSVTLAVFLRGVYDKGSGALLVMETQATLDSGEYLGAHTSSLFAQGRGGFGGPRGPAGEAPWTLPTRTPDLTVSLPTGLNQSLIYRLTGDRTLHGTDPERARADGFERPVLFGMGTYGVACRAMLIGLCEGDVSRFGSFDARFSKPVYPGDRLDTRIWLEAGGAMFQTLANGERVVLDRGSFRFRT
jgi:acyl dehydratase